MTTFLIGLCIDWLQAVTVSTWGIEVRSAEAFGLRGFSAANVVVELKHKMMHISSTNPNRAFTLGKRLSLLNFEENTVQSEIEVVVS